MEIFVLSVWMQRKIVYSFHAVINVCVILALKDLKKKQFIKSALFAEIDVQTLLELIREINN